MYPETACKSGPRSKASPGNGTVRFAPTTTSPANPDTKEDAERFSDTSWQIHRQWRAGGEAPTWPVLQQTTGQPGQTTGQTSEKITAPQNSWPPAPHEWRADQPQTSTPRTTPPRDPSSPNQVGILTSPRQNNTEEHDGPNGRSRSVELSYAADRLLALWLPAPPADPPRHCLAPGPERDVARMLSTKHGQHYMVFDVSEQPGRAVMEHPGLVCELGWARGMAPPLEKLCALCKHLDSWLAAHPTNVAVLRSCGNKERLSVAVSAYLKYSSICGKSEHALDRCSMARFLESSPSLPPSNKRYVEYFAGLLAGGIRVNAAPLWLTHVTVVGAPPLSHVFLKLYEGMVPIYTSNVYSLGAGARQFTASLGSGPGGVAVRGDVLLRCYSRPPPPPPAAAAQPPSPQQRRLIFSCQFHTCAITDYTLTFTKYELDFACNDASFPVDGTVEIQVSGGRPAPAPTPAVRVRAADDAISRWDSLQHLPNTSATSNHSSNHSSNHTSNSSHSFNNHHSSNNQHSDEDDENQGVLGGSSAAGEGPIYATVSRRAGAVGAGSGGPPPPSSQGAPPGTSSPLSASLDSGISSAGRRQGSPSPGARRKELDDLLRDMLRTVEALPAPAPASNAPQSRADRSSNNTPKPDNNIPYHARPDSRPFTYGDATMLRCQAGLSSPSLVRRALRPTPAHHEEDYLGTNGYTNNNHLTDTDDDAAIDSLFTAEANESFRRKERREALSRLSGGRSPHSPVLARRPDMQLGSRGPAPPQSPGAPRKEHRLLRREEVLTTTTSPANHNHVPLSDNSHSIEFPVNREYGRSQSAGGYPAITQGNGSALGAGAPSPLGGPGESGLTWLQRQQQRLRARRDQRLRTARLPLDRSTVGRTSASHRLDGYTSDTTAFADDDDDFSIPLHVQTSSRTFSTGTEPLLPNRTSSRKFMSMDRRGGRERSMSPTGADFLDSPRDHIAPSHNGTMTREESLSSWRSVSVSEWENGEGEESRGATPAFPTTPRTPYGAPPTPPARLPPRSPITQRKDFSTLLGRSPSSPLSATTPEPLHDVSPDLVKFVRDTSKFWYKPNISRDDAITLLQNQDVGSFIIRDSNSFPNAFGLAVKVSPHAAGQQSPDLVRHFLIERTSRGVRLKGCADEPVFGSLSALVYQHSVTPLALPARLRLPASDPAPPGPASAARALLAQGAACSVLYLGGMCCEALTGPEAISRTAARLLTGPRPCSAPAAVHFKVSAAGITLTDSARRLFFRRHYPATAVSHCGLDPGDRRWSHTTDASGIPSANRIFGFVSRRPGSSGDNECHMFAELEPEQPASAIVNFVSKVMLGQVQTTNIV